VGLGIAVLVGRTGPGTGEGPSPCHGRGTGAGPGTAAPAPAASGPPTHVHVKLRSDGAVASALGQLGPRAEAMFAPLPPGAEGEPPPGASPDDVDHRARWLRVRADSPGDAHRLAARLAADTTVEQAFVEPEITLPTSRRRRAPLGGESCPVTTPSFESYQGYLGPAPHGIDAPAAWRRGFRGAGVWFADVEGGWNAAHEDLPGDRIAHVSGRPIPDPSWRAHGTAVLGQVVGRDNGKGVVGIAPDVERVLTSSIGGQSVARAIDQVARELRPGDVLLIELQGAGPRGRFLPVEYWDDVFDAIRAATRRGVIVIEAAGNGNEDLDHPAYDRKLDRARRDSGAIMVGAGAPPREGFVDRARLDFSNYGSRVDVQGWGRKVATLDYGDLQACDDGPARDRHYTGEFSGTSSASPIVAGAAVILEGIARARGAVIAPARLRDLLRETGTPQAGDTRKAIGPRPDLERAIRALLR
jgi:subtilisin family serine protease